MDKVKILLVEDDPDIRLITSLYLEKKGFEVLSAEDGWEGIKRVEEESPALILLDVLLPGIEGFEVCRKIRNISGSPIIFTSCKRTSEDKIEGLNAGGDDYLTKPYDLPELEARINANLRRNENHLNGAEKKLREGSLLVDTEAFEVYKDEEKIKLYAKEYQLLLFLMSHKGQVFSSEQIYNQIWGLDMYGDLKTVSVHIRNLRKKIELNPKDPQYILTVRGFGYKFSGE